MRDLRGHGDESISIFRKGRSEVKMKGGGGGY